MPTLTQVPEWVTRKFAQNVTVKGKTVTVSRWLTGFASTNPILPYFRDHYGLFNSLNRCFRPAPRASTEDERLLNADLDPARLTHNDQGGFRFRLTSHRDAGRQYYELFVQTRCDMDWTAFYENKPHIFPAKPSSREVTLTLKPGTKLIVGGEVVGHKANLKKRGQSSKGLKLCLTEPEEVDSYLRYTLGASGLEITEATVGRRMTRVSERVRTLSPDEIKEVDGVKQYQKITDIGFGFTARGTVTDPVAFAARLVTGIGHGRTNGFGLLHALEVRQN